VVLSAVRSQRFFFSSRRRHTRFSRDWSSDVCSSDLLGPERLPGPGRGGPGRLWSARGRTSGAFRRQRSVPLGSGSLVEHGSSGLLLLIVFAVRQGGSGPHGGEQGQVAGHRSSGRVLLGPGPFPCAAGADQLFSSFCLGATRGEGTAGYRGGK